MKSATELLEAYLNNVRTPGVSASQFAPDGVQQFSQPPPKDDRAAIARRLRELARPPRSGEPDPFD
jgi:hypothetical protein